MLSQQVFFVYLDFCYFFNSCFVLAFACNQSSCEHWIGTIIKHTHISLTSYKKLILARIKVLQKDLRPWHKSVQRDESNSAVYIFFGRNLEIYFEKGGQKRNTQNYTRWIWILFAESFSHVVLDFS